MNASENAPFLERCAAVAEAAQARGVTVAKVAGEHALRISGSGAPASFPIVSDEEDWQQTTPDEALYVVLSDAYAWYAASPDDAKLAAIKDAPNESFAAIKRDWGAESSTVASLAALFGGIEELKTVWVAAGFLQAAA
jgi:hypothetical protein